MKIFIHIILILLPVIVMAQQPKDTLDTEVIQVVKPYVPTISDADKLSVHPQEQQQSEVPKQPVSYQINSVPVASTFTPSKGKAKKLKRRRRERLYDNYISIGFGNYTTPLAEAYLRTFPSRGTEAGMLFSHHSSQTGTGVELPDSFYNTRLKAYYQYEDRGLDWKASLEAKHRLYHWYGMSLPESNTLILEDLTEEYLRQRYLDLGIGGEMHYYDSFFTGGKAKINTFSDKFDGSEIRARIQPEFELPITSEIITAAFDLDYVNGSYKDLDSGEDPSYQYFNFGFIPEFKVLRDDMVINLGVKIYMTADFNLSESRFRFYPKVHASYALIPDVLNIFAGVDGGYHLNTYSEASTGNPYLSAETHSGFITVADKAVGGFIPTDKIYRAFGGIKGRLAGNILYNLQGSYADESNKMLYISALPASSGDFTAATVPPYRLQNSFRILYKDIKTMKISGDLTFEFSPDFELKTAASLYDYQLPEDTDEAWNLPALEVQAAARYDWDKFRFDATLFYVGKREDMVEAIPYGTGTVQRVELDQYIDLNAGIKYVFNERLTAFVKGHNLLNTRYERFYHYPVQGIQVLGGITYKFDL